MKRLQNIVCALALLSISLPVLAGADLKIAMTIVPDSCTPEFSNGGVVDYGVFEEQDLHAVDYTILPEKQIDFSLICEAPTVFSIKMMAGRSGTVVSDETEILGFATSPVPLLQWNTIGPATGIGKDKDGNNIGGMVINIKQGMSTVDGSTAVDLLVGGDQRDNLTKKLDSNFLTANYLGDQSYFGWGVNQNLKPLTSVTATMDVQAYIAKQEDIDLSQTWNLDGLVTFEVRYR